MAGVFSWLKLRIRMAAARLKKQRLHGEVSKSPYGPTASQLGMAAVRNSRNRRIVDDVPPQQLAEDLNCTNLEDLEASSSLRTRDTRTLCCWECFVNGSNTRSGCPMFQSAPPREEPVKKFTPLDGSRSLLSCSRDRTALDSNSNPINAADMDNKIDHMDDLDDELKADMDDHMDDLDNKIDICEDCANLDANLKSLFALQYTAKRY